MNSTHKEAQEAALRLIAEDPDHIVRKDEQCGSITQWIGTQEALVAASICSIDQFPEGRKRYRSAGPILKCADPERWWSTQRLRGRICQHTVHRLGVHLVTPPARVRGASYGSPEAFAQHAEALVRACASTIRDVIGGEFEREAYGETTLVYDRDTIERVVSACDLIEQLVQAAVPGWTKAVVAQRRKATELRADAKFCAFLAQATTPGRKA